MKIPGRVRAVFPVTAVLLTIGLAATGHPQAKTVAEVIQAIEKSGKMDPLLERIVGPRLDSLTLICIKDKRMLEVWANGKLVKRYGMTAFSGGLGPKRMQGDGQIPEGIYQAGLLNPNSSYHLSIKVSYPNQWDRNWAKADGRGDLGGDIFIHGDAVSIGCIPIGDENIEEVFYLVHKAGLANTRIIISPFDFRKREYRIEADPKVLELYEAIKAALKPYAK